MRITINFPDEIAEKLCRLPNRDVFVSKAVADALAHEPEAPAGTGLSRWAQLVERIERNPLNGLDPTDRAVLQQALDASQEDVEAGRLSEAEEVLRELREP